jgi:hypothetical protein
MGIRRPAFVLLLLALLLLASLPLAAQTVTGTIQGTVTDRSGAVLPGVTVTIRNLETGLERVVVTNDAGFFNAPFLPIGRYRVNAELAGMGSQRRENVPINLNQTTVQDFIIDPQMAETITVQADAPRINVTDGEIKQTMRSEEIMTLPAASQTNFLRLAEVFSGFQENPTSGQNNPTSSSGSSINFHGTGTRGATFQINGVNNDDSSENQNRQGVALATIKSFQILTNNFSSEFGRGYGAVVLVQTKSGTNDVAGEVYGYFQDAKYNELDVFNKGRTKPERYNRQYGIAAGFPVLRDTLFAFVHGDMIENKGSAFATRGLFTAADLALPRLTLGNDTPANREWQNAILARWPSGLTPNASANGARAYTYPQGLDWPDRDYSGRLDWNMSANNNINARYQKTTQKRGNEELIIGEQTLQDNRQSNLGLTWTGILSANTVQEARYGLGLRSTNVNILDGNDTPIVRINDTGLIGASFTILGNAGAFPINRNQRDQQFVYNISSAHWSAHTIKAGTDIRFVQLNDTADNFSRGFWTFSRNCAGVDYGTGIAAFMAGCVSSFQKGYANFYLENSIDEQNYYAQDDWRIRDNLVVNAGVRYEHVNAAKEDEGRIDYLYGDSDYWDPRVGFAYTPDWNRNRFFRALTGGQGRFSIRGGYGHFHGRVFQSIFSQGGANVRFNPPNAQFIAATGTTAPFTQPGWTNTNIADPSNGYVFVPGTFPTSRFSITTIDEDLQMPETRQWNLTFERQMFAQSRLRLSYVGTLGKGLIQYGYGNLPISPDDPSSPYDVAADWRCAGTGSPGIAKNATCPNDSPIAPNEISLRVPRTNERRPDARYTTNLVVSNGAETWYHGGELEWQTAFWRGLQARLTYTYSKSLDSGSEATFVGAGDTNILGPLKNYNRGYSRFDVRHRGTLFATYMLPFFQSRNDWVKTVLGGWQISTVVRIASGTPFTITDGGAVDANFDGIPNGRPVCINPNGCNGVTINDPNTSVAEMNRNDFRRFEYGDSVEDLVDRNSMRIDGPETVDLSLRKAFALPFGSDSFEIRLDAFNVFDRVTWGFPDGNWNATTFGRLASLNYTPRYFQLGVRYIY